MEWKDIFSVGYEPIDNQHKKFIEIINKVYNYTEMEKSDIIKVLKELEEYGKYHFLTEEEILVKTKYPFLEEHKEEHDMFVEKVSSWIKDIEKVYDFDLFDFLVDWLTSHILDCDRKYASWIMNNLSKTEKN